jgi:4-hydroxy-3-methylbut-2-enyl diphosphate reductase
VATPRVLITAHGISNRERALLAAGGREIIDTTCPLVRKAHRAALALAAAGFFVIVIGKKGHVEVRGLTGDLPVGGFEVVETQMGVRCYGAARLGVLAQTTAVECEARQIVGRVRELNPDAEVRFVNTICQPTRDRQAALERLLEVVDVLVVVGGRYSNNTRELVARARQAGVRAVHVEDAGELVEGMFGAEEVVGLTAGTSTLAEAVAAVRERLGGFHHDPFGVRGVEATGAHELRRL